MDSYGQPYGNLVAAAKVTISEGSASFTTGTDVYGFSGVTLIANVATLVLGNNSLIDPADSVVLCSTVGTVGALAQATQISDSIIDVSMIDSAGAPIEAPFNIVVFRKGIGG